MERKKRFLFLVLLIIVLALTLKSPPEEINISGAATATGTATICIGRLPSITTIADQTGTANTAFSLQVSATFYGSNTSISYYDNSSLFNIDANGLISFTPSEAATDYVEIIVEDSSTCGSLNSTDDFKFTIDAAAAAAGAGDAAPGAGGGGGAGAGGGGAAAPATDDDDADEDDEDDEEEAEEEEEEEEDDKDALVGQALFGLTKDSLELQNTWNNEGKVTSENRQGEIINFRFTDNNLAIQRHEITVNEVNVAEKFVTLIIQSEPITVTIKVGESVRVDLNKDGQDDLIIFLASISKSGKAKLTFEKTEQWIENEKESGEVHLFRIVLMINNGLLFIVKYKGIFLIIGILVLLGLIMKHHKKKKAHMPLQHVRKLKKDLRELKTRYNKGKITKYGFAKGKMQILHKMKQKGLIEENKFQKHKERIKK